MANPAMHSLRQLPLAPAVLLALLCGGVGCEFDSSAGTPLLDAARDGRAQAYDLPRETVAGEVARVHLESMLRVASISTASTPKSSSAPMSSE